MEVKELRIGNYLKDYYSENTIEVTIKVLMLIEALTSPDSQFQNTFVPIPLTEEWKLKLGFKKKGIAIRLKLGNTGMELCWIANEDKLRLQTIKSGFTITIEIKNEVHVIQNLYFALTGEELTLKE